MEAPLDSAREYGLLLLPSFLLSLFSSSFQTPSLVQIAAFTPEEGMAIHTALTLVKGLNQEGYVIFSIDMTHQIDATLHAARRGERR